MPPVRVVAIIGFVVAVAVVAVVVGLRPTIVDGRVMTGFLRRSAPVTSCSDAELTRNGALFRCMLEGAGDESYEREYFMDRNGTIYDAGNR